MLKISYLRKPNNISNNNDAALQFMNGSYRTICTLILSGIVLVGFTGCGQKGELYLVDTSSQTVTNSSDNLESTSNPQDAAFANIDDADYQNIRYLEQKQVLPDVTDDPNDY